MADWQSTPGGILFVGEPEDVGKITTVKQTEIGFSTYTFQGTDVCRERGGEPITDQDSLAVGDIIYAADFFGIQPWKVTEIKGNTGTCVSQPNEVMVGWLKFGADSRRCWALEGTGNLKSIQRLELSHNP